MGVKCPDSPLVEVRLEHRKMIRGLDGAADLEREKPGRREQIEEISSRAQS